MRMSRLMGIISSGSTPITEDDFTFSGEYSLVDGNLKLLTNGTFTPLRKLVVDVFLVGGGGGGNGDYSSSGYGPGGGGGYTITSYKITLTANEPYTITIGAGGSKGAKNSGGSDGGNTSAFGITANGGKKGGNGGNGASGGGAKGENYYDGGSDGSNAQSGGTGQGTTTREFGGCENYLAADVSASNVITLANTLSKEEIRYLSESNATVSIGGFVYTNCYRVSSFDATTKTITLGNNTNAVSTVTAAQGTVVRIGTLYSSGGAGFGGSSGLGLRAANSGSGGHANTKFANDNAQAGFSGIVIVRKSA